MSIADVILQQAISRVIVDKQRIPRAYYEAVEPVVEEVKRWGGVVDSIDLQDPVTWFKAGGSVLANMVEPLQLVPDPIETFFKEQKAGWVRAPGVLQWFSEIVMSDQSILETAFRHENKRVVRAPLPNGSFVFIELDDNNAQYKNLWFPKERDEVYEGLRNLFWKDLKTIVLDHADNKLKMMKYAFPENEYQGEVLDYIHNLKQYMDSEIRRVIILQGEPGTGKSTLCANAIKILSERTIVITIDFFKEITRADWGYIMKVLKPTLVIADDIDRVEGRLLEQKLPYFEDAYYNVPVTLLTTNNQGMLPMAFRRPGRVDQIIKMPKPTPQIQVKMINDFAKREGLGEVPEENMALCKKILNTHPPAHLVELMRRYKAEGWDYDIPDMDMTFGELTYDAMNLTIEATSEFKI